jgi:hypothetical protein
MAPMPSAASCGASSTRLCTACGARARLCVSSALIGGSRGLRSQHSQANVGKCLVKDFGYRPRDMLPQNLRLQRHQG